MSHARLPAILLSLAALILALPSCGLLPFQRSATLEISFTIPDDAPAPAGFVAAVMDELAAQEPGSRVFDPATAFIRAVITAPDIPRPIVLTAPYESGPVSMRVVAPVGDTRHLTVTALDAERSELTRGEIDFEVKEGLNELTLWMKPVEELLPADHAFSVGPMNRDSSPPSGGLTLDAKNLSSGTSYFYADLPVDGVYRFSVEASPPPSSPPVTRLYDKDGKRVQLSKDDSPFPGRFSLPAGRLYLAVDNPHMDYGNLYLVADLDWRPSIRGLTYAASAEGELDSRDPLILDFPNSADGMDILGESLSFGDDSSGTWAITGNTLTLSPGYPGPLGDDEWSYWADGYSLLDGEFTDPILGITRNFWELDISVPVRTYLYLDPVNGDDRNTGRPASPLSSIGSAIGMMGDGYSNVRYILAQGLYLETASITAWYNPTILGGFIPTASGPWLPDPAGWSEIRLGTSSSNAQFTVDGPARVEGLSFKHSYRPNASPAPSTTVEVIDSSASGQAAAFTRCRFYSPGYSADYPSYATSAVSVSSNGSMIMDRCSVNWPLDADPDTLGGSLDCLNSYPMSPFSLYGVTVSGASLAAYNSIISGGALDYPTDASFYDIPEISAVHADSAGGEGWAYVDLTGNTLLSGTAPDTEAYSSWCFRNIISSDTGISSLGNLFINQTTEPIERDGYGADAFGIKDGGSPSSVDYCAFSNLSGGGTLYATTFPLTPDNHSLDAPVTYNPLTMLPTGVSAFLTMSIPPELLESYPFLSRDFYGRPRLPGGISVGAVEYR